MSKNCTFDQNRHSGPDFHWDKLQPESSLFKTFWMPDQVRHDGLTDFMEGL